MKLCIRKLGNAVERWENKVTDQVKKGRGEDPDYAKELSDLEDDTEFVHDISGWLEDYLDELDMNQQYEKLQKVCDKLLAVFAGEEDKPSEIRFLKSSALSS